MHDDDNDNDLAITITWLFLWNRHSEIKMDTCVHIHYHHWGHLHQVNSTTDQSKVIKFKPNIYTHSILSICLYKKKQSYWPYLLHQNVMMAADVDMETKELSSLVWYLTLLSLFYLKTSINTYHVKQSPNQGVRMKKV